jgi:hypothetical protein
MTESLAQLSKGALNDLSGVFAAMREDALDGLIEEIVKAKRIVVFGLGREGLQMRGFAMRLFHMGRDVAVWGDMTTPALGARERWSTSRVRGAHAPRLSRLSPQGGSLSMSTSSRSFPPKRWRMTTAAISPSCQWALCSRPRR